MNDNRPKHVAIIMDGNGRWAKQHNLPKIIGYQRGVESARQAVIGCLINKVEVLTLFAFSSENWQRPASEVNPIMRLISKLLVDEIPFLQQNQVRVKILGCRNRLNAKLVAAMDSVEGKTRDFNNLCLNIAVNYGGRWDLSQAMRKLAVKVQRAELLPEEVTEELIEQHLSLAGIPCPDLLIRTSGELRLSNFLLWHLAYTELDFPTILWPDFTVDDLTKSLTNFASRQRKFGGLWQGS